MLHTYLLVDIYTHTHTHTPLQVSISCPYWLVNRTGLPLVFRQEGVREEAAGQSEEHEKASTSSPLLYSYQDGDTLDQ